jgi:hypothetical protein
VLFRSGNYCYYEANLAQSGGTLIATASKYAPDFAVRTGHTTQCSLVARVSTDGGVTWGAIFQVFAPAAVDLQVSAGRNSFRLADGRWCIPFIAETASASMRPYLAVSSVAGPASAADFTIHTWTDWEPTGGYSAEVNIFPRSDGKLFFVWRPSSAAGGGNVLYYGFARYAIVETANFAVTEGPATCDGLASRPLIRMRYDCLGSLSSGSLNGKFFLIQHDQSAVRQRKSLTLLTSVDNGATWQLDARSPLHWSPGV